MSRIAMLLVASVFAFCFALGCDDPSNSSPAPDHSAAAAAGVQPPDAEGSAPFHLASADGGAGRRDPLHSLKAPGPDQGPIDAMAPTEDPDDDNDTGGDDDNDDNDDDNDTSPDVEYPSIRCTLPDPAGLGAEVMMGGGPISGTVTAYVYDDLTCGPLSGVSLITPGAGIVQTDGSGRATLMVEAGPRAVTAYKNGYWSWSYAADAAVMYFRLIAHSPTSDSHSSESGQFRLAGQPLELTNPQDLLSVFLQPLYGGVALTDFSRDTALMSLLRFADGANAVIHYVDPDGWESSLDLPGNFWVPYLDVTVPIPGEGDCRFYGGNDNYVVPVRDGELTTPLEGFVFGLDTGQVVDLETLVAVIVAIADGGDLVDILSPVVLSLLNRGLVTYYVGATPNWSVAEPPGLAAIPVDHSGGLAQFDVTNRADGFDYLCMWGAEIPHRALLPLGVTALEGGPAPMAFAAIPDADYLATALKTNLFQLGDEPTVLSGLIRYAEDLSEVQDGLTVDDAQFLPGFDPAATAYESATATVTWVPQGDPADYDLFLVALLPEYYWNSSVALAVLPGDARSHQFPAASMGITTSPDDLVLLFGVKSPGLFESGFDPSAILGYNHAAFTMWSNPDLGQLLQDIFGL
jgi:hypothetical protein